MQILISEKKLIIHSLTNITQMFNKMLVGKWKVVLDILRAAVTKNTEENEIF